MRSATYLLTLLSIFFSNSTYSAEGILTAEQIAYQLAQSKSIRESESDRKINLRSIRFEFSSSELTEEGKLQLDELARALKLDPFSDKIFTIGAHTDAKGSSGYNEQLSRRRADVARRYLVERHGIQSERLLAVGYGENQPLPYFSHFDEKQRRIEVKITGVLPEDPTTKPSPLNQKG
jgi:outer membrane protein OmpA-like peptidoglycan-associated protein